MVCCDVIRFSPCLPLIPQVEHSPTPKAPNLSCLFYGNVFKFLCCHVRGLRTPPGGPCPPGDDAYPKVPRRASKSSSETPFLCYDSFRLGLRFEPGFMPQRTDIETVLIIGAGPIVIGQACEFDYSGVQACKALKQAGYRIVLVNSNPATIMTDPEFADATYVEPLTCEFLRKIIDIERPDALLPTVGGQTALNLAVELAEAGILQEFGVELIGAGLEAMRIAEDREQFKQAITKYGLQSPRSYIAYSLVEARKHAKELDFPIFIRPSFTLGGSGAGTVFTPEEFDSKVSWGLSESPVHSVLVEESLIGWKEFELEVMRDGADNFVVVCSIENLDAMGVHTGDSITVAPAQTLTDKELQRLRNQARLVMRAVGVETGGSNVQFAVHPDTGRVVVIEMNPRVSRSSALASKATGFPIAKWAALVAVGYNLDELTNDITQRTVAAFEPSIDYVVVKIPRWAFEKFSGVSAELGPQMKSVGEAMSIGRTFKAALQKGIRSLEIGRAGWGPLENDHPETLSDAELAEVLHVPNRDRLYGVYSALGRGWEIGRICELTRFDPWFVDQLAQIHAFATSFTSLDDHTLRQAKRLGCSDLQIAELVNLNANRTGQEALTEANVRALRWAADIHPTFHQVDTCAAEFQAVTPYLYSSFDVGDEALPNDLPKIIILGGGPNRIGQGIEFDYCCVHASFALQELHYETIMVNCNPETVSTDYDTSSRLYFEPLTHEDVLHIVEREASTGKLAGVIVQFGGQTPLNLAADLEKSGVQILGTSPSSIDLAEDRFRFGSLLQRLDIPAPAHGVAHNVEEALLVIEEIGYPVVVRPSYVLGGRAMAIVYEEAELQDYMEKAALVSPKHPVFVDQFLENAVEVDVDAICDGERVVIGGIMQHIEKAGVHSGDSACVLPPNDIKPEAMDILRLSTHALGTALQVRGLMNIQYAIKDDKVFVIEVNPRASRTVPFVSKATGVPLAKIAAKVIAGESLESQGLTSEPPLEGFFVKEAVLPWKKFYGFDTLLGPEMRSTGEVMGHAKSFGHAFAKSQTQAGSALPSEGGILITVGNHDKVGAVELAREFHRMDFSLYATQGTARALTAAGIPVQEVRKAREGGCNVLDAMRAGNIGLIVNTPYTNRSQSDGTRIRALATRLSIPLITTMPAARAALDGIESMLDHEVDVRSLQDYSAPVLA